MEAFRTHARPKPEPAPRRRAVRAILWGRFGPHARRYWMLSSPRRFYRRLRYGQPIVVVSGLPRSGTSMVMKMLEAGGLPVMTDGIRTADEDNPKGYYEVERVKDLAREAD